MLLHTRKASLKMSLTAHENTNTEEKPYACHRCQKRFSHKDYLKQHEKTHTERFQCTECLKWYSSKHYLTIHERTHRGQKPHQCSECKKCFSVKSSLTIHKRIHTGKKPYQCTECQKCFTEKAQLIIHQRKHTGQKPYQCTECQKRFTQKGNLMRHEQTHKGQQPYRCTEFQKCSTSKTNVAPHERIHTGDKPYKCEKGFTHGEEEGDNGGQRHSNIKCELEPQMIQEALVMRETFSGLLPKKLPAAVSEPSISDLYALIRQGQQHMAETLNNSQISSDQHFQEIKASIGQLGKRIDETNAQVSNVIKQIKETDQKVEMNSTELKTLRTRVETLEARLNDAENWNQRVNMRLFGIPEGCEGEDPRGYILNFLRKAFPEIKEWDLDHEIGQVYRYPSKPYNRSDSHRPFRILFEKFQLRELLFSLTKPNNPRNFEGMSLFTKADISRKATDRRSQLRPYINKFTEVGGKAYLLDLAKLKVIISGRVAFCNTVSEAEDLLSKHQERVRR